MADDTKVPMTDILTSDYKGLPEATAAKAVANLRGALASVARYQGFARYLSGTEQTVTLENSLVKLDITTKGGMISRAALKNYQRYDSTAVTLMAPDTDSYSFTLMTANQRLDTREFYFTPVAESDTSVVMQLNLGDGAVWGIRYVLQPDSYIARMEVVQTGMNAVIPTSVASMDFTWTQKMARNEAGRMFEERNSALYYMFANGDVENLKEGSSELKEVNERVKWIGYKNQFFSAVIIPDTYFTTANLDSEVLEHDPSYLKKLTTEATLEYSSTLANPASFTLFLGPNSYPLLSDLQKEIMPGQNLHLTNLIPLGWALFRWINTLIIIPVFSFLGGFISNYGIIILLLTIFIKIILFPFTYKSYMSQARMRVLAPEIKEINDKWPGNENAMKRQQESMALYSRAGASPFSGCLPMLLQFPVLIAMFNFFPSAIELRGKSFLWAHDLSAPDAIVSWTTNIPLISSTFGNHISLFCLLMTAVNIIYTRINMQNQPGGNSMPGMKWMMYLMPLMFLVFFNNYAAGLSYYYFLSLLITIAQTYVFRKVVNEEKVRAMMRENAKKPRKKSAWMQRLEEAQRQQQAMLRERERQQAKGKRRH
ncbi:MAG: membrane protein insertase YidC [Bacteroides sp.]|nr:membrane protein insertase YidC [Barnesiella sp.]MBD5324257.1 membrane protein insertase YidC [Bacteroides sp.]MBD5330582.1 membrane protein insertase YidC [Bacteroides sp.]MBD5375110.1 membrane protein insertase YidC [Bacteroides sp.]MDE7459723.1 membrane protein insertase YidC [Paramuribaculum sp.]